VRKLLGLALLLAACTRPDPFHGAALLHGSSQHVLVIVDSDRDSTGWRYRYANGSGRWAAVGAPIAVFVGAGGGA